MKTIEYTTRDKSVWPRGEWDTEYDKKQWQDEETGYPCLIVRSQLNALCGYVGVNSDHPLFEKNYDDADVRVHGGLTFADKCLPGPIEESVCHLVEPGEDEQIWWFGFDCAHFNDMYPGSIEVMQKFPELHGSLGGTYRNVEFVEAEVASLAKQLKDLV